MKLVSEDKKNIEINLGQNFSKSFMYSIHQMYFLVQKHLEHSLLKKKELTFSQFMIFVGCSSCAIEKNKTTPVSQSEVAERLFLTEATVSRHVTTLVELGYLSKKADISNGRKHSITITPAGLKKFKQAEKIISVQLESIFTVINQSNRTLIIKNFEKVLSQLLSKK